MAQPVDFQKAIRDIKLDVLAANFEGYRQENPKLLNLFEAISFDFIR